MHANYNTIAAIYDPLARLVYGNALEQAQSFLLPHIPAGTSVLIVGGGTGWLLEELCKLHSSGLRIVYVEVSSSMMTLSRKRDTKNNDVEFVPYAIQDTHLKEAFGVIITPFVLDNFTDSTASQVFTQLDQHLVAGGLWLYADFQWNKRSYVQQLLLKTMYLFFKVACNLEATHLPDTATLFRKMPFQLLHQCTFYHNFIIAQVYRKRM